MKYINLFEQFLNELKVGGELLGDHPDSMGIMRHEIKIWNSFKLKYEVNTEDEQEFLKWLKMWTNRGIKKEQLAEMLSDLLPLKKQFPSILDPAKFKEHGDKVYRVTAAPIRDIIKLKGWQQEELGWDKTMQVATNSSYTHKVKSTVALTSFTTSQDTIEVFVPSVGIDMESSPHDWVQYLEEGNLNSKGALMTVVLELPIEHPKLLMNPQAVNALSKFNEYEIFYVGKSIKPSRIFIPEWDLVKTVAGSSAIEAIKKYFNIDVD